MNHIEFSGPKYIGARLRIARREKNLTQDQLGAQSGDSQAVIQKIENGNSIRPRNIMALAAALGVNPAWLQFGEPYATRTRPEGDDHA
jgi:transcriptional regulator with XRE-family HTH domain